ncbi:hypothetical protein C6A37_08295 [Desulfobacteraceae bacterium SEEP-SAG9]|nr:hypothetical protein C6A37_08295 [Desulfobacteraceae bacterium SEEP-SAG9]
MTFALQITQEIAKMICETCYFYKIRDAGADGRITWGPFCLRDVDPVKCQDAVRTCDIEHAGQRTLFERVS